MSGRKSAAQRFFTEEEARRVRAAVAAAEAKTSGEIVVMVASASHDYPEVRQGVALLAGLFAGLLAAKGLAPLLWWPGDPLWLFLAVFLGVAAGSRFLLPLAPASWRWAVPRERARFEVEREAVLNFYGKKLHHTRQASGVLLFISVLERRVHILADTGVARALPRATWEELVRDVTQGIREGRAAAAAVAAVDRLGALLASAFPAGPEDENELADLIIVRPEDRPRAGEHLVIR